MFYVYFHNYTLPPKSELFNDLYICEKTRNNYWAAKVNKGQNHAKRLGSEKDLSIFIFSCLPQR